MFEINNLFMTINKKTKLILIKIADDFAKRKPFPNIFIWLDKSELCNNDI